MKKIIISIIAFCFAIGSYAQEFPQINTQSSPQNNPQKEPSKYEQVQSVKIAFFTTELGLTPKEAEEFWPIYNKFWKEREVAHRKIQGSMKFMSKMLNGEKPFSDAELKKMLEIYVNSFAIEGVIQRKYYDEFSKVLSTEKVAKLYKAEEDFRIKMIHQLRKGGGPGEVKEVK
ncbi:MAG: hypothetical protein ABFC28_06400 [Rikenellaceae bacterium]